MLLLAAPCWEPQAFLVSPVHVLRMLDVLSLPHLSRGRKMLQSTQQHLPPPSLSLTHTLQQRLV